MSHVINRDSEAVTLAPATPPLTHADSRPDVRLAAIKATDVILAALQAAFGQDKLLNGSNPYKFNRDDPKASKVWVCDPGSRVDERDGNRMIITVSRGDYQPQELHFMNNAGSNFCDVNESSDLAQTPVFITCEAGAKTASEVLASIVYNVIKIFRQQLMAEYDIHSIRLTGITPPVETKDVPGNPWTTTVNLRLETQEHNQMVELANHMNKMDIDIALAETVKRGFISLDSTPQ